MTEVENGTLRLSSIGALPALEGQLALKSSGCCERAQPCKEGEHAFIPAPLSKMCQALLDKMKNVDE
ncbi:putative D-xylulose reductase A [Clarias magur]|uniref:Putative D-xylulose reductase A n=1 Tax=Clarias magur TaxID=1594786 RepID=A0A8J4UEL2_CLAMG|nr:putative D-xylulose reductase A [Clarias magur]